MKKFISIIITFTMIFSLVACGNKKENKDEANLKNKDWNSIVEKSKGTTVTFYGWGGSELTNKWIDDHLAKELKEKYNITLKRVPMDIEDILNKMIGEKQVGSDKGTIDVVWINGENFYTAKKNDLLYGPFSENLPNYKKYIDRDSNDVKYDFGKPVEAFEAPYGKAQFVMVYDEEKVTKVPKDHRELLEFVKANPGKFTYAAPPDFTGSAFVRNIIYDIVGYEKLMKIKPEKELVEKEIKPAIDYLKEIKPYLWNKGKTYPANIAMLDNMYADKQVINTMSYNPNSVTEKIDNGTFPEKTQISLFKNGTIGNTHFVAIPFNSPNKEGAMVTINSILSFEMQKSKYDPKVWGDLPVFDNKKLSEEEKKEIEKIKVGSGSLPQSELLPHRLPELPAELVPIIEKIWQENIPGDK
ncbi:ABC transporter substrate-binding protein [Clostridium botulinum]|uniref:ABC transporter substrate-binding protein n=1 Tax=Clostridium botulinum TaxID=1491 RepID=A0A846J6Z3_CLOBO|nr:ABC transporter substrate-binding protein [Clostridium botulinum]ACA55423.1 putative ABC transporter, solute-binding protein [Clostridium botulinum A3 str. Loch Maree]NFH67504.1 ABC transporter substrate-binding protein [Clostridium botulinum]NFJ09886.1 ABC transporter substrate-binding protein [Clostridium botulinum]NFK14610.1 ABC transporter substrate-binding protein [Clostridium botulinum]NFM95073.1 ABC transporter substrate-binding protein [Clostridium botulinum]